MKIIHSNYVDGRRKLLPPPDPAENWLEFTSLEAMDQATIVTDLAERLAGEFGADYCDPGANSPMGCSYVKEDGTPSCLIGQILYYLGYPGWDRLTGAIAPYSRNRLAQHWHSDFQFTEGGNPGDYPAVAMETIIILAAMQGAQDRGGSWGVAHAAGEAVAHAFFPGHFEV